MTLPRLSGLSASSTTKEGQIVRCDAPTPGTTHTRSLRNFYPNAKCGRAGARVGESAGLVHPVAQYRPKEHVNAQMSPDARRYDCTFSPRGLNI
jgi:hypothetical protein